MENTEKMKFSQKLEYGIGTMGKSMSYGLISGRIMYYFNNVLRVDQSFAAALFFFGRLWDGINDLLMGTIVDNTKSRLGKFRPWILIGAVSNAIVVIGMFYKPSYAGAALMVYLTAMYVLQDATYTMVDVGYWSMIPALSLDSKERESISLTPRISAVVGGRSLLCGNSSFLTEEGVSLGDGEAAELERLRGQGKATLLVSENGGCIGIVALSDTLRDTAKSMTGELKAARTATILLTGDHRQTAEFFAAQAGITDVRSELLPSQKVETIEELERAGHRICMIGDGVNDAPALKTAYVGVAMGGMGSDIAIEAADITLMGDDISKVPYLKRLSNAAVRLIKLNITISMTINFVAIILSVMGVLNPVTGAIVHNVGSVLVTLNAALLYDRNYQ